MTADELARHAITIVFYALTISLFLIVMVHLLNKERGRKRFMIKKAASHDVNSTISADEVRQIPFHFHSMNLNNARINRDKHTYK